MLAGGRQPAITSHSVIMCANMQCPASAAHENTDGRVRSRLRNPHGAAARKPVACLCFSRHCRMPIMPSHMPPLPPLYNCTCGVSVSILRLSLSKLLSENAWEMARVFLLHRGGRITEKTHISLKKRRPEHNYKTPTPFFPPLTTAATFFFLKKSNIKI